MFRANQKRRAFALTIPPGSAHNSATGKPQLRRHNSAEGVADLVKDLPQWGAAFLRVALACNEPPGGAAGTNVAPQHRERCV
jgi:hypothetical protein